MPRPPLIPPQSGTGAPEQRFDTFAKRLLAVPKSEIDAQEKRHAARAKKTKHG